MFDVEKQACDWKDNVFNCDQTAREVKVKPLVVTDEPICTVAGELACGDASCIKKELFCDGIEQCSDGSDENACGELHDTVFVVFVLGRSYCIVWHCREYYSNAESPSCIHPGHILHGNTTL